jgi:hypothetical protein
MSTNEGLSKFTSLVNAVNEASRLGVPVGLLFHQREVREWNRKDVFHNLGLRKLTTLVDEVFTSRTRSEQRQLLT